jgi:hypothetical protein
VAPIGAAPFQVLEYSAVQTARLTGAPFTRATRSR